MSVSKINIQHIVYMKPTIMMNKIKTAIKDEIKRETNHVKIVERQKCKKNKAKAKAKSKKKK